MKRLGFKPIKRCNMTKPETFIARQAKRLSKGQIDRRRFVMSALATGVTMPTAMSLASRAEALVPKSGGHLRYGAGATLGQTVRMAYADTLVDVGRDGAVVGSLADAFWSDDGGTTWTFNLRPGVTFHSGRALRADDVLTSFADAAASNPKVWGITRQIAAAYPDGDARVILRLHRPHQDFARLLATPDLTLHPKDGAPHDGTGAYRLHHIAPGTSAHLVRRDDDWRAHRGHFDRIDVVSMPDAGERQGAVMNGEVDVIDDVDPRALAMLSTTAHLNILEHRGTRHHAIHMRMDQGPFQNPDLRTGLKALIDRQALCNEALLGHGDIGQDAPWRFEGAVPSHDPDRARWHIRAADVAGPVTLAVAQGAGPGADVVADLVARAAQDVGLKVVVQTDGNDDWDLKLAQGSGSGDASFAAQYMCDAGSCDTGWTRSNKARVFDEDVRVARSLGDGAARDAGFADAARTLVRDGALILPLWATDLYAHSNALKSPAEPLGTSPSDILTRWWFA